MYVSTNQHADTVATARTGPCEREESARRSSSLSGEIQPKKGFLRNHYPCTACGDGSHTFESCILLASSDCPLNIDRTLTFSEYEEGQARSGSHHAKKSSSFAVDLLEDSRGHSPPPSYHANRNHASSHRYDHSYSSSNPDRDGYHAYNQQYRGDCERRTDRTLYKHFPCTACGMYTRDAFSSLRTSTHTSTSIVQWSSCSRISE